MVYADSFEVQPIKYDLTKQALRNCLKATSNVFLRLCQFFGAAPIQVNYSTLTTFPGGKTTESIWLQRLQTIVHRVWCTLYFAFIVYCMYMQHHNFDDSKFAIEKFLFADSYFIRAINLLVILSGPHQKFYEIFDKVVGIDERLFGLFSSIGTESLLSYDKYRRFIWRFLGVIMAILAASTVTDLYFNDLIVMQSARSCMVYIVPNITIALCLAQYLGVVQMLRWRFQQINESLTNVLGMVTESRNPWEKPACPLNYRLNELRLMHLEVDQLNRLLCKYFGYVLFNYFVSAVLVLAIQQFTFYSMIRYWDGHLKVALIVYTVLWIGLYAGQIASILYLNDRLNVEVEHTYVHTVIAHLKISFPCN